MSLSLANAYLSEAQCAGVSPDERDVLLRSILRDLAKENGSRATSEERVWTSWDQESLSYDCLFMLYGEKLTITSPLQPMRRDLNVSKF
jgi:hypothetical protein